jgi:hypothetical protein
LDRLVITCTTSSSNSFQKSPEPSQPHCHRHNVSLFGQAPPIVQHKSSSLVIPRPIAGATACFGYSPRARRSPWRRVILGPLDSFEQGCVVSSWDSTDQGHTTALVVVPLKVYEQQQSPSAFHWPSRFHIFPLFLHPNAVPKISHRGLRALFLTHARPSHSQRC